MQRNLWFKTDIYFNNTKKKSILKEIQTSNYLPGYKECNSGDSNEIYGS